MSDTSVENPTKPFIGEPYVSLADASEYFGISKKTLRRLVFDRKLAKPLWISPACPRVRISEIEDALRLLYG